MEKIHNDLWYEEFCNRLESAKVTMLQMGFDEKGLDELIEEMMKAAGELSDRNGAKVLKELHDWEGEGGAIGKNG